MKVSRSFVVVVLVLYCRPGYFCVVCWCACAWVGCWQGFLVWCMGGLNGTNRLYWSAADGRRSKNVLFVCVVRGGRHVGEHRWFDDAGWQRSDACYTDTSTWCRTRKQSCHPTAWYRSCKNCGISFCICVLVCISAPLTTHNTEFPVRSREQGRSQWREQTNLVLHEVFVVRLRQRHGGCREVCVVGGRWHHACNRCGDV